MGDGQVTLTFGAPNAPGTAQQVDAVRSALTGLRQATDLESASAIFLVDQFKKLQAQQGLGVISNREFRASAGTIRDQLQALSAQVRFTADDMQYLGTAGRQMNAALSSTGSSVVGISRVAYGATALSHALDGGTLSARGLASAVGVFGGGTAMMQGALAGLTALTLAYALLREHIKTTADEHKDFEKRLAEFRLRRVVSPNQTQAQVREDIAVFQRQLDAIKDVPLQAASGGTGGASTGQYDVNARNEARREELREHIADSQTLLSINNSIIVAAEREADHRKAIRDLLHSTALEAREAARAAAEEEKRVHEDERYEEGLSRHAPLRLLINQDLQTTALTDQLNERAIEENEHKRQEIIARIRRESVQHLGPLARDLSTEEFPMSADVINHLEESINSINVSTVIWMRSLRTGLRETSNEAKLLGKVMTTAFTEAATAGTMALLGRGSIIQEIEKITLNALKSEAEGQAALETAKAVATSVLNPAESATHAHAAILYGIAAGVLGGLSSVIGSGGGGGGGGGSASQYSGGAAGVAGQKGDVTVVMPRNGFTLDPRSPQSIDDFMKMMEAISGRNVFLRRG